MFVVLIVVFAGLLGVGIASNVASDGAPTPPSSAAPPAPPPPMGAVKNPRSRG